MRQPCTDKGDEALISLHVRVEDEQHFENRLPVVIPLPPNVLIISSNSVYHHACYAY